MEETPRHHSAKKRPSLVGCGRLSVLLNPDSFQLMDEERIFLILHIGAYHFGFTGLTDKFGDDRDAGFLLLSANDAALSDAFLHADSSFLSFIQLPLCHNV
jgi:hypothetical protein